MAEDMAVVSGRQWSPGKRRVKGEAITTSDFIFFSSRRRHTRLQGDWSSDVCSSDLQHDTCARLDRVDDRLHARERIAPRHLDERVIRPFFVWIRGVDETHFILPDHPRRSEERRVGKECRSRWSPYH